MPLKLAILILTTAAVGSHLLALRHQRLEAVHQMAEAVEHAAQLDRELWPIRVEIARLTHPTRVRALLDASDLGPWHPIRPIPTHDPALINPADILNNPAAFDAPAQ